ncbi:MAG: hypothetical protein AAF583_12000 [Pseudomonadota bacterium]
MVEHNPAKSLSLHHAPLTQSQTIRLVILGIITWYAVGVLLAWLGGIGAYNGSARIILYALIFLSMPAILFSLFPLAGIARNQLVLGTSVFVASASLCDGLAMAWLPHLYGDDASMVAGAGGTILWGVGAACALSFLFNREPN